MSYGTCFPDGLSDEDKAALLWKIEKDYRLSNFGAASFKDEYVTFAINFYTRNIHSLEDVRVQYRAHLQAQSRMKLSQAFLADMILRQQALPELQ